MRRQDGAVAEVVLARVPHRIELGGNGSPVVADGEVAVDQLLDKVAGQGGMDVIADLARPVPSTVICQMIGVPLADFSVVPVVSEVRAQVPSMR